MNLLIVASPQFNHSRINVGMFDDIKEDFPCCLKEDLTNVFGRGLRVWRDHQIDMQPEGRLHVLCQPLQGGGETRLGELRRNKAGRKRTSLGDTIVEQIIDLVENLPRMIGEQASQLGEFESGGNEQLLQLVVQGLSQALPFPLFDLVQFPVYSPKLRCLQPGDGGCRIALSLAVSEPLFGLSQAFEQVLIGQS